MICFGDGRPFVDLDLRSTHWCSTHPCNEDTYQLVTDVCAFDVVHEAWRARGPSTDYDAMTVLTRLQ